MKNKNNAEVISAAIGGVFFAVPYLALAVPIIPSLAIGAAAFAAGELVFRPDKIDLLEKLKDTNISLYNKLNNAKKDCAGISKMIPLIEDYEVREYLENIVKNTNSIISTIERFPEKEKKLKNYFDYYLPVTLKLAQRYDEIENQKLKSKESNKFFENTKNTLKEIDDVFGQFLNNLYEADMSDANVEIKVLNSMLKSDGLGKEKIIVKEDNNE